MKGGGDWRQVVRGRFFFDSTINRRRTHEETRELFELMELSGLLDIPGGEYGIVNPDQATVSLEVETDRRKHRIAAGHLAHLDGDPARQRTASKFLSIWQEAIELLDLPEAAALPNLGHGREVRKLPSAGPP